MPGFGFHVDGKHFKNRALDSSCVTVNFSPRYLKLSSQFSLFLEVQAIGITRYCYTLIKSGFSNECRVILKPKISLNALGEKIKTRTKFA